jgi:hypothetical protein
MAAAFSAMPHDARELGLMKTTWNEHKAMLFDIQQALFIPCMQFSMFILPSPKPATL